MSEIEKLMQNAGIELIADVKLPTKDVNYNIGYPPFTAEKQLEIVKFILCKSVYYDTNGDREYWFHLSDGIENSKYREFDEAIAECINNMWNYLKAYEKKQIKEILND